MSRRRAFARQLVDPAGPAGFLTLSALVGVLVGVFAAGLILGMDLVTEALGLGHADAIPWWLPFATVPVGLGLAHYIACRLAPEAIGDGVPETAAGLSVRAGYLPTRAIFVKFIATILTVGSGGSAGREGPVVQIGGTIGSSVARRAGLGEDKIHSLVAAGAGAAIGASFNAPIAGMLFALEVLLGGFALRHLNAVVVASVTAAVTSQSLVGSDRILSAFPFQLQDARELLLYAALGILAVGVAMLFLRLVDFAETLEFAESFPSWLRAALFGVAVAVVAAINPEVLGDGQEFVSSLVRPNEPSPTLPFVLISLALLKVVATSLTLGGRGSGGAFMPSLFIGAALGAGFGELVAPVWGISDISPGAFAIIGMAATFAAVARAPLTAILIVFEITGDYGLVLPLMLATSLATFLADRANPQSIYSMALERMGIRSVRKAEIDLLDTIHVGQVFTKGMPTVVGSVTTAEAQRLLDANRSHGLAVVSDNGDLLGLLAISDIMRSGGPSTEITAAEVMTPKPITVQPGTPVSNALERMAALGVGRLPVVDPDAPDRLIGMFGREDAVRAYHLALAGRTEHEQHRQRLGARTHPGSEFFDFEIVPGSIAANRPIRQIAWPAGATVVSIRRNRSVFVPNGDTELQIGDNLTIYGTSGGRSRIAERLGRDVLEPPDDDPITDVTEQLPRL